MSLDPSIPLSVRPIQFDNPMELQARGLQLQALNRQNSDAVQAESDRRTLADLYRANMTPDGKVNHQGVLQGLAQAGMGDKIPAYQKTVADEQTSTANLAQTTAQTADADFSLHKKKLDVVNNTLSALISKTDLTQADVIGSINGLVNQGIIDPNQGAQMARMIPGKPEQLRPFLTQKALETMDAAKQVETRLAQAPKYNEQNRGGTISEGTVDPLTGQRTESTSVAKTAPPVNPLTTFSEDTSSLLAALASKGVSLPTGMRSKEQQISTLNGLLRKFPDKNPDEIAELIATGQVDFGAIKKETSTAAAQAGRVAIATNELRTFAPIVLEASAKVPRGQFVPITRLMQMGEASISDPNLRQLRIGINSMLNAYDQLAARGGTDMNKRAEAHSLLNSADSPEALAAAIQMFQKEAEAAGKAAAQAQRYHKPGEADEAPPADVPPADVPTATGPNGQKLYLRNGQWATK